MKFNKTWGKNVRLYTRLNAGKHANPKYQAPIPTNRKQRKAK